MTPFQRKILRPILKDLKNPGDTFVFVSQEFGYKYWFWFPQMSGTELERRWKSARSYEFAGSSFGKLLSVGIWLEGYKREEPGPADYSWESFEKSLTPKTFYDAGDQHARIIDLVHSCDGRGFYTAHIFCDDDCFLKTPKGKYLHHATYWQSYLESELRIDENRRNEK